MTLDAMPTFQEIKEEAARVTRNAGFEGAYFVPLETVAASVGYHVLNFSGERLAQGDVAGAINHENKQIFVNSDDAATRQRFTLAHEIGHAVLHAGDNIVDYRKNIEGSAGDRKEIEANYFAACLLMPEELFKEAWRARAGDAKRTAKLFGVSEASAKYRAMNLGV